VILRGDKTVNISIGNVKSIWLLLNSSFVGEVEIACQLKLPRKMRKGGVRLKIVRLFISAATKGFAVEVCEL
jgi:hypothetical protein